MKLPFVSTRAVLLTVILATSTSATAGGDDGPSAAQTGGNDACLPRHTGQGLAQDAQHTVRDPVSSVVDVVGGTSYRLRWFLADGETPSAWYLHLVFYDAANRYLGKEIHFASSGFHPEGFEMFYPAPQGAVSADLCVGFLLGPMFFPTGPTSYWFYQDGY